MQKALGFTLVELLITIAIIGILASIAVPSYRNYVIRANRADAQQALVQAAQNAERFFTRANTYVGVTVTPSRTPESGTKIYDLATQGTVTVSTFVIRATPVTTATNGTDGIMEITSTGERRWDRNNDGDTDDTNEKSWAR